MSLLDTLRNRLAPQPDEDAYEETVEHDIVMRMVDGKLKEVTADDT